MLIVLLCAVSLTTAAGSILGDVVIELLHDTCVKSSIGSRLW